MYDNEYNYNRAQCTLYSVCYIVQSQYHFCSGGYNSPFGSFTYRSVEIILILCRTDKKNAQRNLICSKILFESLIWIVWSNMISTLQVIF